MKSGRAWTVDAEAWHRACDPRSVETAPYSTASAIRDAGLARRTEFLMNSSQVVTARAGDSDPEFWTYWPEDLPRPSEDPLDDPVFSAKLTLEVARRDLAARTARLDLARDLARQAHEALMQPMEETRRACDLLEEGCRVLAQRQGGT